MKKSKKELDPNKVESDTFHVGIELECITPCDEIESEHNDDACYESQREYVDSMSEREILCDYLGLSKDDANSIRSYFDFGQWRDDYMSDWSCDGGCDFHLGNSNGENIRNEIEYDLKKLTNNNSFKVESDSSIDCDENNETDTEICWNYFASKENIKDNEKIMDYLKNRECKINKSCGLHININNYLKLDDVTLETTALDFLFNIVAPSRKNSNFCNKWGLSSKEKYSMIYHQGKVLEFRFFSPTFDADKLNHYVILANVVYKRLANIDAKLPKKTMLYLLDKMIRVNGLTFDVASDTLKKVNSIVSIKTRQNNETLKYFALMGQTA